MSRIFPSVSLAANGDTFASWISKTNQLLALSANTVTLATNSAGDISTGNGFVIGIFGATTLVANSIAGGNVSSNSPITILNNVNFSNTVINYNNISSSFNFSYSTSNNAAQIIDSFAANTFAGGKYVISVKNNVNLDRHMTEILLVQSSSNVLITEYASLFNNTSLGTFSANVNTGTARLWFTPANANNTLQVKKDLLAS